MTLSAETLEHIDSLERGFAERAACDIAGEGGPDRGAHVDFDVVLAGGGLSLIYGAYLQQRGLRVAIFDRRWSRGATSRCSIVHCKVGDVDRIPSSRV